MASADAVWLDAFILHTRKYTDTRLLIELFTREQGRVSAVARLPKKHARSDLQVCLPVNVILGGRSTLKTVMQLESAASSNTGALSGKAVFYALYFNELIQRLLPEQVAHPAIFELYKASLDALITRLEDTVHSRDVEPILRLFELSLLQDLGFGMDFTRCADDQTPIVKQGLYCVDVTRGFIDSEKFSETNAVKVTGETLLAIYDRDFNLKRTRQEAKKLCRVLLKPHLGSRPLKSRELFV